VRWLPLLLLFGCSGPAATDVALCRDYIHRVCQPTVCDVVTPLLPAGADCETTLLNNSRCSSDSFTFTNPSRDTFLECRLPLLRAGDNVEDHPDCLDVADSFQQCPEVVTMLDGGTP
jgi:hypothetical protein